MFVDVGRCDVEPIDVVDASLGPRDVVVRSRASLVSPGTELAIFTREHRGFEVPDHWARYPWYPGYATVGEVVACGADVEALAGRRVFHRMPHASAYRLPADWVQPVPDGIGDEDALFFTLLQIAMTALRRAPLRFGEQVVVIGQGIVGNLVAQLAREAGARRVAGADLRAPRLAVAARCGVDEQWDLRAGSIDEYLAAFPPPGAEYVVEAVGAGASVDAALKATAPGGRCVLLGSTRATLEFDPYFDVHKKGIDVIGAHEDTVDPSTRARDRAFVWELLASGRVAVTPIVTHRVPFAEAQRAYEGLRDDKDHWLGAVLEHR